MTSDIAEQLRAWAEPISSGYEVPRAAVTLYAAADEIEALRSRLAEYELLKRAVNESGDCLPTCDANAHDDHCPNVNMHVVLQDQQRKVERLRSRLAEVTKLAYIFNAEAEALLRDIAEMRVPVLPSRFMDESMAEAARAHLARKQP